MSQSIGSFVTRTFDLVLEMSTTDEALVELSFENVDYSESIAGQQNAIASVLGEFALLPSMTLDSLGRVISLHGLRSSLEEGYVQAGEVVSTPVLDWLADSPHVIDSVLDQSVNPWFGFWLTHSSIPQGRSVGSVRERSMAGIAYDSTTEVNAVANLDDVSSPVKPDGAIALGYVETMGDVVERRSAGFGVVPVRLTVSVVADPATRRPFYVSASSSGQQYSGFEDRWVPQSSSRRTTFNWADAEGCG